MCRVFACVCEGERNGVCVCVLLFAVGHVTHTKFGIVLTLPALYLLCLHGNALLAQLALDSAHACVCLFYFSFSVFDSLLFLLCFVSFFILLSCAFVRV